MKKLLSLLLALIAILSLSACDGDKEEQSSSSTTPEAVTEEVTTAPETTTTTVSEETKGGLSEAVMPDDGLNWGDFEVVG